MWIISVVIGSAVFTTLTCLAAYGGIRKGIQAWFRFSHKDRCVLCLLLCALGICATASIICLYNIATYAALQIA